MSIRSMRLRDAPRRGWRVCVLPVAAHPLALAFALTLVMISPVVADAKPLTDVQTGSLDTRIYTVSVDNEGGLDVTSKYSAACWMCGINPSKLDSDMRSKLSNSGSGGRFFDFAQQFQQYYLNPTQAETLGLNAAFMAKILLWGDSWGFWRTGALDKTLYSGAMTDLAKVMRGESLGDSEGQDATLVFSGKTRFYAPTTSDNINGQYCWSSFSNQVGSGAKYKNVFLLDTDTSSVVSSASWQYFSENITYVLHLSDISQILSEYPLDDYYYFARLQFGNTSSTYGRLNEPRVFIVAKNDDSFNINYNTSQKYYWDGGEFVASPWIVSVDCAASWAITGKGSTSSYTCDGSTIDHVLTSSDDIRVTSSNSGSAAHAITGATMTMIIPLLSQSVDAPTNNWPDDGDDDPTPRPPDVPNPPDVHLPEPGDPIIPNPPVYEPDPTGTDYVPYLLRIIHCLQDINTSIYYAVINLENALSEHCLHIRTMMAQCLGELCDYMFELCQWLAEQLSFDVSAPEYDDSTVVSWLMRIYDRISSLNFKYPSYRPSRRDIDDGFDWWGWLLQTIADIFGENFEAGIEGYLELLRGVLDKFPFSVPWDFLAVYGLLVAVPATPVFDVTIPAVTGWWSAITYHIDLHPFDHVAGAVRHMVMLLWVVVLIRRTKWMTGIFESGALVVSDFLHNRG